MRTLLELPTQVGVCDGAACLERDRRCLATSLLFREGLYRPRWHPLSTRQGSAGRDRGAGRCRRAVSVVGGPGSSPTAADRGPALESQGRASSVQRAPAESPAADGAPRAQAAAAALAAPPVLNQTSALDLVSDTLYDGRRVRALTIIDEGNREGWTSRSASRFQAGASCVP